MRSPVKSMRFWRLICSSRHPEQTQQAERDYLGFLLREDRFFGVSVRISLHASHSAVGR